MLNARTKNAQTSLLAILNGRIAEKVLLTSVLAMNVERKLSLKLSMAGHRLGMKRPYNSRLYGACKDGIP